MTTLLHSVDTGDLEGVKQHIEELSLNPVDGYGDSALHISALKQHIDITRLLIAKGANVNAQNNEGKTALHYAAEYNALSIAHLLINAAADVNLTDTYGNGPLWTAVFNAKEDIEKLPLIKLLLDFNADKNHKNNAGMSLFDFATQVDDKMVLGTLENY